jgi:two-component system chemotaxis response regulator CheB
MIDPVRVLVVDDSAAVRRVVQLALAGDEVRVVGTAPTGEIALAKIPQLAPDVVTLDVEMPAPDGLATLAEIRRRWPTLPVVMLSALTRLGAEATVDALSLGASDYVTKPTSTGGIEHAVAQMREALLPRLLALAKRPGARATDTVRSPPRSADGRIDVVAIGASTGGPAVLHEVIPALPADFPVPILVVQHMPPVFTTLLAERLAESSAMRVREAESGLPLLPGEVWIAPGDFHLALTRVEGRPHLHLHQGMPEQSCRPAADVLFRSVAEHFGGRALGVVLTGMGQDGLRGAESIVARDGRVWAQDEASSVVWGMPGFVVRAGLAQLNVRPEQLAALLTSAARLGRPSEPATRPA